MISYNKKLVQLYGVNRVVLKKSKKNLIIVVNEWLLSQKLQVNLISQKNQ